MFILNYTIVINIFTSTSFKIVEYIRLFIKILLRLKVFLVNIILGWYSLASRVLVRS